MKSSILRRRVSRFTCSSACAVLLAGSMLSSCEDDLLTGMPSWLHSSIYEELQRRGNFKTTLELINDPALNYAEVLKKTGSKTLFVADDDAYARFFSNNEWNAKSLRDLTAAQKKLLFNSSMVNNAYLMEMLSTVGTHGSLSEPADGMCMRRATAVSVYDSVPRLLAEDMPKNRFWDKYRNRYEGRGQEDAMLILKDNSAAPMIHFLEEFMLTNKILPSDYDYLTNHETDDINTSYINGVPVVEQDIVCQNGYVHVVRDVVKPLKNMAEIIAGEEKFSIFHGLLERFSAPFYNAAATEEYNALYGEGGSRDSVFVKRYFNSSDQLTRDEDGNSAPQLLRYDPGKNNYIYNNSSNITMAYDAGLIFVPNNDAMMAFWNGAGLELQQQFGTWENLSDSVAVKLLNNLMISSFVSSVPSKFDQVMNTAQKELGVRPDNLVQCYIGCNGVVMEVNEVFQVPDYISVSSPALINTVQMGVIGKAIEDLNYTAYLNSLDSKYSFFIPTNEAMKHYVDPLSIAKGTPHVWEFYVNAENKMSARVYEYDMENDVVGNLIETETPADSLVTNRLDDLLNNLIVVGLFNSDQSYYRTKAGGVVKIEGLQGDPANMTGVNVYGSYQEVLDKPLEVSATYDKRAGGGNGIAYSMDTPLMTTTRSVYSLLSSDDAYSEFLALLSRSSLMGETVNNRATMDMGITVFNNYHYTMYVPTNESIRALIDEGKLPTWDEYDQISRDPSLKGDEDKRKAMLENIKNRIENFLRYHMQDNALYIDGENADGMFETAQFNMDSGRFSRLTATNRDGVITVTDALNNVRVITAGEHSNKLAREYVFNLKDREKANRIYSSSYVVVHQIDEPLFYSEDQFDGLDEEESDGENSNK